MSSDVTVILQTLNCIHESDGSGHSEPYIWPALFSIDVAANVSVTAPAVQNARVVIKNNMSAGESAVIPATVGRLSVRLEDNARGLILAVAMLESDDGPDHALKKGFSAFTSELRQAIADNLLPLSTATGAERTALIAAINKRVSDKVQSAIKGDLSTVEKIKIAIGTLDPDDIIDADFQNLAVPLVAKPLILRFGPDKGGRLLFYRDQTQNGTGDVNTPAVIGLGGWQGMKFLFSGDNGIIYAVNQQGQLLFYRDSTQNGTGDVNTPKVIGLDGWQSMKFLFSGGNGIIYAVKPQGQLLFYRDNTQNGTGDVNTPKVIGQGGWQNMKFLFSGGDGIIYAVNQQGQLLFYRDTTRNGTGDVNSPRVIGLGGWQNMKFLFSGGNGIIYAVDPQGELLFYRDTTRNGTGDVSTPHVIGLGGWQDMQFLFSSHNGIIYAVDKFVLSSNNFEIQGNLQVTRVGVDRCQAQVDATKAAQGAVEAINQEINGLQADLAELVHNHAPKAAKDAVLAEIKQLSKVALPAAQVVLDNARKALQVCRTGPVIGPSSGRVLATTA
jgi:Tachylectin